VGLCGQELRRPGWSGVSRGGVDAGGLEDRPHDGSGWPRPIRALLTFLWVLLHDRPGSGGQRPPRVRSAMAISASGLW